jgi:hypothetical protein
MIILKQYVFLFSVSYNLFPLTKMTQAPVVFVFKSSVL